MEFSGVSDQPTEITILFDSAGVCNIVFERNGRPENLAKDMVDCLPGLHGITERKYRLPKEPPLVGFHGMAEEDGLDSLGLILLDT